MYPTFTYQTGGDREHSMLLKQREYPSRRKRIVDPGKEKSIGILEGRGTATFCRPIQLSGKHKSSTRSLWSQGGHGCQPLLRLMINISR